MSKKTKQTIDDMMRYCQAARMVLDRSPDETLEAMGALVPNWEQQGDTVVCKKLRALPDGALAAVAIYGAVGVVAVANYDAYLNEAIAESN